MEEEQYTLGIDTAEEVDEILQKAVTARYNPETRKIELECYNPAAYQEGD